MYPDVGMLYLEQSERPTPLPSPILSRHDLSLSQLNDLDEVWRRSLQLRRPPPGVKCKGTASTTIHENEHRRQRSDPVVDYHNHTHTKIPIYCNKSRTRKRDHLTTSLVIISQVTTQHNNNNNNRKTILDVKP